jgi:isopentenyldiphosphate isomerase/ASC-1-like (ASCH) protein
MDEEYDVLDESGNSLGFKQKRSELHLNGKWHAASHIWIINPKRELLITRRSLDAGTSPGAWTMSAGGHVDSGETPLESAIREVKEEIGIEFSESRFKKLFVTKFKSGNYFPGRKVNQFHHVFLIESDLPLEKYRADRNEVIDIKFIHHGKLKRLIANGEIEMTPQYEQFDKLFEYLQDYTIEPGLHKIGLPERPFRAIQNGIKTGEIRTNVPQSGFDYFGVKAGDRIKFFHEETGEDFEIEVKKTIKADSAKELLEKTGLEIMSSNPTSIQEGVNRIHKLTGYEEAIKRNGLIAYMFYN